MVHDFHSQYTSNSSRPMASSCGNHTYPQTSVLIRNRAVAPGSISSSRVSGRGHAGAFLAPVRAPRAGGGRPAIAMELAESLAGLRVGRSTAISPPQRGDHGGQQRITKNAPFAEAPFQTPTRLAVGLGRKGAPSPKRLHPGSGSPVPSKRNSACLVVL